MAKKPAKSYGEIRKEKLRKQRQERARALTLKLSPLARQVRSRKAAATLRKKGQLTTTRQKSADTRKAKAEKREAIWRANFAATPEERSERARKAARTRSRRVYVRLGDREHSPMESKDDAFATLYAVTSDFNLKPGETYSDPYARLRKNKGKVDQLAAGGITVRVKAVFKYSDPKKRARSKKLTLHFPAGTSPEAIRKAVYAELRTWMMGKDYASGALLLSGLSFEGEEEEEAEE